MSLKVHAGLGACVAAAAIAVAGCGSSESGSSSSASSAGGSGGLLPAVSLPQSDAGFPGVDAPDKPATGKPLTFGIISLENNPQGSFPETRQASEAAAKYLNAKTGGIAGRKVVIKSCLTDGSPEQSTSCANKLVQQGVDAFIGASDYATLQTVPLLGKAGKAFIGGVGFGGAEATADNSFQFVGGSPMLWPVIPQFSVQRLGAKSFSFFEPTGNPGAKVGADLVDNSAAKLGILADKRKRITLDPTAADVTPQMSQANASDPDVIVGITTGTQCVALAQAVQSLGIKKPFFEPSGCSDPKQLKQMGSAAKGIFMGFEVAVPGDDGADVKLYDAAMDKYGASKTNRNEFASAGFQAVLNSYTVLNDIPGDQLDDASILKAFQGARDVKNFMGPNFSCDHPVKAFPAICNPKQTIAQYDGEKFVPVSDFLDPSAYAVAPQAG